jgi:NAD(P)-dependent dehydrogenase (short-subunit alcohol dehydrogenase family)
MGFNVIATGRDARLLESLKNSFSDNVTTVAADLASKEGRALLTTTILGSILSHGDTIKALVHCAASVEPALLTKITENNFDHIMQLNVHTPIFLTQSLMERFDNTKVLFISSGLAHGALPGMGAYAISKAALLGVWRSFGVDVKKTKAIFGTFLPGTMNTEMQRTLRETSSDVLPAVTVFQNFHSDEALKPTSEVANFAFWVLNHAAQEAFEKTEWDVKTPPAVYLETIATLAAGK